MHNPKGKFASLPAIFSWVAGPFGHVQKEHANCVKRFHAD
jgi:hypothetical protein